MNADRFHRDELNHSGFEYKKINRKKEQITVAMAENQHFFKGNKEMDTLSKEHASGLSKPGTMLEVPVLFLRFVKGVVGFLAVTEEEKVRAGIYLDRYDQDTREDG